MPEYRNERSNIINKRKEKNPNLIIFNIIEFILVCFIAVLIYGTTSISSSKVLYIPKGGTGHIISYLNKNGFELGVVDELIIKPLGYVQSGWIDIGESRLTRLDFIYKLITAKSGKPKTPRELKEEGGWRDNDEWYKKYPEDLNHYKYPDEVIAEFKNAYEMLRKAEIYAQRVDWLLAGDDGNQSFLERLKSDLELLKSELAIKTFEVEDDEDED